MKHFNRHHFAFIPLLSILAMSPVMIEKSFAGHYIDSLIEPKGHPRFDARAAKFDVKHISYDLPKLKDRRIELEILVTHGRQNFLKDQSDKEIVEEQTMIVKRLVHEYLEVEEGYKKLKESKAIDEKEDEVTTKLLIESKDTIEGLLADLAVNKANLARDNALAAVAEVTEESKQEEKKEKKETTDKEDKKEKTDQEKQLCDLEDKNKLLTKQVEQLISDQKLIMQTFMGMAQMMISMYQNKQLSGQQQSAPPVVQQAAYQFHQPLAAGNWVYYPSGFQPQQQNIFAQPQQQYSPQQGGGIYPDQLHQKQSSWGLQPQSYFPDPRFNAPPVNTGNFGNDAFSFNMQNNVGPSFQS